MVVHELYQTIQRWHSEWNLKQTNAAAKETYKSCRSVTKEPL